MNTDLKNLALIGRGFFVGRVSHLYSVFCSIRAKIVFFPLLELLRLKMEAIIHFINPMKSLP